MDSTRKVCHINDDELEVDDRTQDNSQQTHHDTGQSEEMEENGPKSLIMEIYPWIPQFKKMCRSALLEMSMSCLKSLMTYYSRNVRPSVNECRTKPLRAEKLKDCIGETLLFFLYYYREIDDVKDRDAYMILMSDLLAMYVDMELKASKKGNEHSSKISARLSSCLHVYLENSAEHLLDTLLKVHFMTHNYHEIMDPVVTKIFKSIEEHPSSSLMYVRYLLAYRLWKKLNKDVAVRNRINAIAITSLGTAPTDFPSFVLETVLPKVPKSQKLSTKLLLLNKFEVEKSCEEFLNFCKEERRRKFSMLEDQSSLATPITVSLPEDNNDSRESIIDNNISNVTNGFATSLNNSSIDKSCHEKDIVNSKRPSANSFKVSAFRKFKKSNDIVIIDLTSDSVTEKVMRKKKTRRKLIWLEEAKKRILGSKIIAKKDSPIEDESAIAQQPEDPPNLDSLRVEDPNFDCQPIAEEIAGYTTKENPNEKRTIEKDSSPHAISSESITNDPTCTITNGLVDKGHDYAEWRILEIEADRQVVPSFTEVSSVEREISTVTIDDSTSDQYFKANKNCDKRESPSREETGSTKTFYDHAEAPEDTTLAACTTETVDPMIKSERVNDEPNEIISEAETKVSSCVQVSVVEYASEVSLRTSCDEGCNATVNKVGEAEFQENIDGLSLLASVSQSVSQLTAESSKKVNPGELIKVKNYASLVEPSPESVQEPDTSSTALPFFGNSTSCVVNRVVGIYPEDAMDKVAYEVEVTSTEEIDSYEGCDRTNGLVPLLTNGNPQVQSSSVVPLESTTQAEKDDANVILNGETVVLFQKSPNSNLYIINKAVENRDHVDEVATAHREMAEHANETGAFSYEIYDNLYRNQASSYDISPYNRELSSHQESRRTKKVKINTTGDSKKRCDSSETTKSGKTKTFDVVGEKSRGKRKSSTNPGLSRRRRIKQEYESCPSNMSDHMKSDYGIQDCPQEHVDPTRSIHIPVAHSNPLSPIYTKFPPGPELYLPCHKNCNSITRGLTVNATTSLHSHGGKNSGSGNSHRSCLNCAYGIVTHCSECIIPSGETRGTTIDANSYYLPIHSNGQNSVVQERGRSSGDDSLSRIYDDQLLCKLEQSAVLVDSKALENVGVKCEPSEIYRAELDNKLPLKKRFKAIMSMSFNELPIKREKIVQSYPGTPMLSIAALEAARDEMRTSDGTSCDKNLSLDLSSKLARADSHQGREMIRRDYCKDTIMSPPPAPASLPNGCHGNTGERKRKRRSASNSHYYEDQETPPSPCLETNYEKVTKPTTATATKHRGTITKPGGGTASKRTTMTPTKTQARPSEKVKELGMAPTKNSSRQTRSSKRNVPKVNYIYTDGDSDWNPSGGIGGNGLVAGGGTGGSKRKRKKTGR